MVGTECKCDELLIIPFKEKRKDPVSAQMSVFTDKKFNDLTGHKGRSILVNIDTTWAISLGCKGIGGSCSARYDITVEEEVWMAGIKGTNKFEAVSESPEVWFGHRNQNKLSAGAQTFIECTSDCPQGPGQGPTGITKNEGSHFETHLVKKGGGEAFEDITGTVKLIIKPSTATKKECTTAKEWTMILKIKSSLGKNKKDPDDPKKTIKFPIIDVPNSDYDGDGASNEQERKAGTDPFDKTDKPKSP